MSVDITIAGVAYPSPSSAADTDWAAQQVALLQALAAACSPATNWTAVTLSGNWTNDDAPAGITTGFYVDRSRVFLRGSPKNGSNFNSATALTTFAVAARPAHQVTLAVPVVNDPTSPPTDTVAWGTITIATTGVATWGGQGSGSNTAIILDGLSYPLI